MVPIEAHAATNYVQLTNPEDGWQRIDNTDSSIVYDGSWFTQDDYRTWGGNIAYTRINTSSIKFTFYGSKLRLIAYPLNNKPNDNTIIIDNIEKHFNEYNSTGINQAIVFEETGLQKGIHTVIIKPSVSMASSQYLNFDAIDIDNDGCLIDSLQTLNLSAIAGNSEVNLSWNSVKGATEYIIKRSTSSGGSYVTIDTLKAETSALSGSAISYIDKNVSNGTTYYYIVSANVNEYEFLNSNEVLVTPTIPDVVSNVKLLLELNEEKLLSVNEDLSKNTDMSWESSDPSIVTVDGNGLVKALKPGYAKITCSSNDSSYTDTIDILVVDLDLQLAVDLSVGDKCRLKVDDLANTATVTWSAYDSTIATVTSKGKVTAVSEGLTYVSALDEKGNEIGRIYIRVR
jgi:hypothetical protein